MKYLSILIALVIHLFVKTGSQRFPLTADKLQQIAKESRIPLFFLTPAESAFANTKLNYNDGPVSFFASLLHSFDNYIVNPILFNPTYDILNSGGFNKVPIIRFAQGFIIFINQSDYKFIHAGLENNVINCLQDLHL